MSENPRILLEQLANTNAHEFPYDAVIDEFHRVGKHFVADDLLIALDGVRTRTAGTSYTNDQLEDFLSCALDKWDNRYDYLTYTALDLLPLPGGDDAAAALASRDRLVLLLVADAIRFELSALHGGTSEFPRMRPSRDTVAKRCRLALRAVQVPRPTKTLDTDARSEAISAAEELIATTFAAVTPREKSMLKMSMLPVSQHHDEYLFIRVLQAFESTFAYLCVQLRAAVWAAGNATARVAEHITLAHQVLRTAAPLFSLLATMRVESFREFRQFTEGASAIQSRNYKMFESLCRTPDPGRLDSPAFAAVPDVRQLVVNGNAALEETIDAACADGRIPAERQSVVRDAMGEFAATLQHWRRTHYRLAARMLADQTGSGYTAGAPYLREAVGIPVFRSIPTNEP